VHIGTGSVGYSASIGTLQGFTTAAHIGLGGGLRSGDTIRNASGMIIGRVSNVTHVSLQGVDTAFINTVSFTTVVSDLLPGNHLRPVVNMPIFAIGHVSNGGRSRSGSVLVPSASTNMIMLCGTVVSLTDVSFSNLTSQAGDSGGVVYTLQNRVAHSLGHVLSGRQGSGGYFTPIHRANQALGINAR
jgi:hypothetical protein